MAPITRQRTKTLQALVVRVTTFIGASSQRITWSLGVSRQRSPTCNWQLYGGLLDTAEFIMDRATLHQLEAAGNIRDLVRHIGLTPHWLWRGQNYTAYGEESVFMMPFLGVRTELQTFGLWQIPQQFECALRYLSSRGIQHSLTVGTFSGWTDVVLAAYLRRFAPSPDLYTHITFDVKSYVKPCIWALFRNLSIQQIIFNRITSSSSPTQGVASLADYIAGGGALRQQYDFCFIDGDHTYAGVSSDFHALVAHCKLLMFHDVVNRNVGDENVPKFWRELKATSKLKGHVVTECVYQPRFSGGRSMGIGVIQQESHLSIPFET